MQDINQPQNSQPATHYIHVIRVGETPPATGFAALIGWLVIAAIVAVAVRTCEANKITQEVHQHRHNIAILQDSIKSKMDNRTIEVMQIKAEYKAKSDTTSDIAFLSRERQKRLYTVVDSYSEQIERLENAIEAEEKAILAIR